MNALIDAAFSRARVVLIALSLILAAGIMAIGAIPKESAPEVTIPTVYISTSLEGISPQDAISSLIKPLETELAAIEGLSEMTSRGYEGGGAITLEFNPGFDSEKALDDVRKAVDLAASSLPDDATEPAVQEINTALFPIMTVILSGDVPDRSLGAAADRLSEAIEALPGVLEVDIGGKRDQVVDVLIDPLSLETYGLTLEEVARRVSGNNRLIAAGALEAEDGRLVMKVPGLIASEDDIRNLPLKVADGKVVTFADVAEIRLALKDPSAFARIDGTSAIALEIKKKSGANILETSAAVRAVLAAADDQLPGIEARITQDESKQVQTLLGDLQNNVLASIVLVVIVILAFLGPRSAFLVGLSIPGSFLAGVTLLWMSGYTLNIVVLFALILVAGMLVDGAIVVIEYADRRIAAGVPPRQAFADAARRMAWPITSSTATTLCVFLPLLFWAGVVGQFMKFLPITVLMTLSASLVMALVFIPVLGGAISRGGQAVLPDGEEVKPRRSQGLKRIYVRLLTAALGAPRTTLFAVLALTVAIVMAQGRYGNGIEFFPATEPDFAQVQVLSRDNLSTAGKDRLLREVEDRLMGHPEIESLYARTAVGAGSNTPPDLIGTIQLEFTQWETRRPADTILAEIRADLSQIPGLRISVAVQAGGPAAGKPIALEVAGEDAAARSRAIDLLRDEMARLGGITDITDTRPLPGIDYEIRVDRDAAARHGADLATIGQTIQLLTTGVTVTDFRPATGGDEIDIRIRFPEADRSLARIRDLSIPTAAGPVPIGTFVEMQPVARSGTLLRVDGTTVDEIAADVAPGELPDRKMQSLAAFVAKTDFGSVEVRLRGEAEDQAEAMQFLLGAFGAAVMLMLMILVAQFNSISQALLVLSAILFSIAGVLLGGLLTGRPFGIVMGGIGIIALAGIVVNTNIVLIDSYNERRRAGWPPLEAALRTGVERLRPILLTTVTTVLGLVPMALAMSIDIPGREISIGAPSTLWWVDLSLSIVSGLTVATVLTLLATPAALVLIENRARRAELGLDIRPFWQRLRVLPHRSRRRRSS